MRQEDWFIFQEEICEHFNAIGAEAETNVSLTGVRTSHDVDVFVKTKFLGIDLKWIVEAKLWKRKVNKGHVLVLRSISEDLGVDKAFIVSSSGFQSGAIEASKNTNVKLLTLDELKEETKGFIESEILKTYEARLDLLENRYWSHSKEIRIKYELRHHLMDFQLKFTGQMLLGVVRKALMAATDRNYPIILDTMHEEHQGEMPADNFQQLQNWFNLNFNHFESKLLAAEWEMHQNGEYNPNCILYTSDDVTPSKVMAKGMYMAEGNG
ncbi:restriction endonuclease [Vibrio parahaemolyticus]|nr:restriction endonuclease [Vibrio parahaemolyticus]MBE3830548.1 restriction endonuclease [Vibrio parahaemolyticus]MBE3986150.1 restriction endonuclease [Vibrio parahaemolyticus]HCG7195195.1 restriction endonuclease [Vibrio parahaemolyticus]